MTELYEALRAIDVPNERARRCAQAIRPDRLATKADLVETERLLRAELQAGIADLRCEIQSVETE